jgi:alpha-tubulin suppressor-like RCC1 family protein
MPVASTLPRRRLHPRVAALLLMLLPGCGGDATTGPSSAVASVAISPAVASVAAGDSVPLSAVALNAEGRALEGVAITWRSSDTTVATVTAGMVRGRRAGTASIFATASAITAQAQVTVNANWAQVSGTVAAGSDHMCALDGVGRAYCWGRASEGQIGDALSSPFPRPAPTPVRMPDGVTFTRIAAGGLHTLAISTSGAVYAWGGNESGQLGNGTTDNRTAPTLVDTPAGVTFQEVAAGYGHSLALTTTGRVYAWGLNGSGQVGDGTVQDRLTPVLVQLPSAIQVIAVGGGGVHSVALTSAGAAWAWGQNEFGQIGDGTTLMRSLPVQTVGSLSFRSISAGGAHTAAVTHDGLAVAWGMNTNGAIGDGTVANRTSPTPVQMPVGVQFSTIHAGWEFTLALTTTGAAYGWGENSTGHVGDGTTTTRTTPRAVVMPSGTTFAVMAAGSYHAIGRAPGGSLFTWGWNGSGQLGSGQLGGERSAPGSVLLP